ncbi:MAG: sigma-54-dependent Fis family transcriptional regulator [Rhodothermales bacterium]|nr:sigma-54-dependent Fis family transcriptional regulator [Rhodothermales bacterium]
MAHILIVDDVAALAEQYAYDLRRLADHETTVATSGAEALEQVAEVPADCIILDLEMPGMDGFAVLRALEEAGVSIPVIVYTGTGDFDRCMRAVRLGAFSFIDKSEPMQRVVREVEMALEHGSLREEVATLRARLRGPELLGTSAVMQTLRDQIARLAPIPSSVLILGESGSGKELVARALHEQSDRDGPFVAINAGALPDSLVESELFGHERGAFTGADKVHRGAFERAAGGTLFLDEIGELESGIQARLLRALEAREVTRLGGEKPISVTARVVAATHRDLDQDAQDGRFRTDLLYRLNTHVLRVPPLRDRKSDIPELAAALLGGICKSFGMKARRLSDDALAALMNAEWRRNNVRELRTVLERMVIASDDAVIDVDALPAEFEVPVSGGSSFAEQKVEAERGIVLRALEAHDWRITETAASLGLADHASLLKIMRRLGIQRG